MIKKIRVLMISFLFTAIYVNACAPPPIPKRSLEQDDPANFGKYDYHGIGTIAFDGDKTYLNMLDGIYEQSPFGQRRISTKSAYSMAVSDGYLYCQRGQYLDIFHVDECDGENTVSIELRDYYIGGHEYYNVDNLWEMDGTVYLIIRHHKTTGVMPEDVLYRVREDLSGLDVVLNFIGTGYACDGVMDGRIYYKTKRIDMETDYLTMSGEIMRNKFYTLGYTYPDDPKLTEVENQIQESELGIYLYERNTDGQGSLYNYSYGRGSKAGYGYGRSPGNNDIVEVNLATGQKRTLVSFESYDEIIKSRKKRDCLCNQDSIRITSIIFSLNIWRPSPLFHLTESTWIVALPRLSYQM